MLILAAFLLGASLVGEIGHQAGGAPSAEVENQIDSAQKLMQAREFGKALEVLTALMQRQQAPPPDAFILMATCQLNLDQTAKAIEAFERGMSLYPKEQVLEEFYVTLLTNYIPIEQMKQKLEAALAASPRSLVLLRAAAFVQLRLDSRSEQARRLVDALLEIAPDNPNSHYIFGQWAVLNHQEELAIREWEKTLTLASADARMQMDVYTLIGDAENRLNRAERAETAFKKALQANASLEKPNPASAFFYAEFLVRQSRFEESQTVVEQILGWAPRYGPALLQRALHLARTNKPEEAIVAAENALSASDLNPEQIRAAHVLLAKTYFLLKRTADAERHQQWLKSQGVND